MGSRRECTHNRGEAIMSVLGATDWHRNYEETKLIKGLYPWQFVQEVLKKVGPVEFFGASTLNVQSHVWPELFE
jgi:hypothetical protein